MMKSRLFSLLTLACLSFNTAKADVLLSNLDEPLFTDPDVIIGSTGSPLDLLMIGQSFTTSANDWIVNSIDLSLGGLSGTNLLSVTLWETDAAGEVDNISGSPIRTFNLPAGDLTGGYAVFNLSLSAPVLLAADSTYFIIMTNGTAEDMTTINIGSTLSMTYTGVGSIPAIHTYAYNYSDAPEVYMYDDGYPSLFAVNGTVVPEPSAYAALIGLGALGFATYRRRKNA
jgi:hypothetical protein